MPGLSPASIAHSLHSLRWQDIADVLLLTLVFSRLYVWLRHTVAVQIAFGLFTLVVASWMADHLGLILTSYLLSAVGAAATIVIVIVFQHEIRQGLSRVSLLRWVTERRGARPADSLAATIAQAAFSLARRRKGALMVIPRRDSVARICDRRGHDRGSVVARADRGHLHVELVPARRRHRRWPQPPRARGRDPAAGDRDHGQRAGHAPPRRARSERQLRRAGRVRERGARHGVVGPR